MKAKSNDRERKIQQPKAFKVFVCGGAGGIGQPLSIFMAQDRALWRVVDIAKGIVEAKAIFALIVNPVNSIVPAMA